MYAVCTVYTSTWLAHLYYFTSVKFSTADAKLHLRDLGIEDYSFKTGELWTYCGYKKRDGAVKIALHQGFDAVELVTSLNLGVALKLCWICSCL